MSSFSASPSWVRPRRLRSARTFAPSVFRKLCPSLWITQSIVQIGMQVFQVRISSYRLVKYHPVESGIFNKAYILTRFPPSDSMWLEGCLSMFFSLK